MNVLSGSITHDWHLYSLDAGSYVHEQTIAVVAYPPETAQAAGVRQTIGGLAENADLIALTDDPAADTVESGQSTVLERRADGDTAAYLVDGIKTYPNLQGGIEVWVPELSKEEGADLSLFPDP